MTNDKEQKLKAAAEKIVKDFIFLKKESYTESDMWITFKRMFIEGIKSEAACEYWDHNCLENFTNDKAGMYICNICKRSIEKEIAELSENQKTELIVNKNMNLFKNLRASEQAKEIERLRLELDETTKEMWKLKSQLEETICVYTQDDLDTEPPHKIEGKFIELKHYLELKSQLESKAVENDKLKAEIMFMLKSQQ